MNRVPRWLLAIAVGAGPTTGCVGTDVGNPENGRQQTDVQETEQVDVEVRMEGLQNVPSPGALQLADGTRIEEVWIGLEEFALRSQGSCDAPGEPAGDNRLVAELLGSDSKPVATIPDREVGDYCGLDVALTPVSAGEVPESAPETLAGHSLLVGGERADGTAFELRADLEERLSLSEHGDSFTLGPKGRQFLLSFAIEEWIDEGELEKIDGEDPIVVTAEDHVDVYEEFEKAFEETALLLRDNDGDGVSNPSERGSILASTIPEDERENPEREDDAGPEEEEDGGG